MSFLDNILQGGGTANALATAGEPVDGSAAAPPTAGQVLTAVDPTHMQWTTPESGGASGPAGGDLGATYPNPNVVAVHETTGPTRLAFGAIADGEVLKRVGSTIVSAPTSSLPAAVIGSNPYLTPQAVPSAFDDEFDSGSADLAARGWDFRAAGTTVMTRVGDITPYFSTNNNVNPLTAGQYRSTRVGSILMIQLPAIANVSYALSKNIPAVASAAYPNGILIWARIGGYSGFSNTNNNRYENIGVAYASAGLFDYNNRLFGQQYNVGAAGGNPVNAVVPVSTVGGTFSTVPVVPEQGSYGSKYDVVGALVRASTSGSITSCTLSALMVETGKLSGMDPSAPLAAALNINNLQKGFIELYTGTGAPASTFPYHYAIDFARCYVGDITNKWIVGP